MTRGSFVFYRSFYEGLSALNDADRLAAYDAIVRYGLDGVNEAEGVAAAVLALVRPILDANNRKVEAGRKGGQASVKQTISKSKQIEANTKQTEANQKLNEKCEMRNDKGESIKDRGKPTFTKPTVEEVRAYCLKIGSDVDPQRFWDYYESQKWKKANGQKVADWKACVRTWNQREKPKKKTGFDYSNQRPYTADDFKRIEQAALRRTL